MWIDYSLKYIRNNRLSSIFLAGISFLAAALLSLTCGIFYNLWADRVYRTILQTGSYTKQLEPVVIAWGFVMAVVCVSLIVMIHNAFEVSMNSRLHQLGILKSIGASPGQIRSFLIQEAVVLGILPVFMGILAGILLSYGFIELIVFVTRDVRKYTVVFRYHYLVGAAAFTLAMITVVVSAWIPAKRISRLAPLKAIYYGGEPQVEKMRPYPLLSRLFGVSGELAAKSLYSRRKELRTSAISLTLAFASFSAFLNIETVSGMSTQNTYFEYYRDKWDLMLITGKEEQYEDIILENIRNTAGVDTSIQYHKITAVAEINESQLYRNLPESDIYAYVLDSKSFQDYCRENNIDYQKSGGVVGIHTIRDSTPIKLDMRHPNSEKQGADHGVSITVPVFCDQLPVIREKVTADSFSLVVSREFYETTLQEVFPLEKSCYNIRLTPGSNEKIVEEIIVSSLPGGIDYFIEGREAKEAGDVSMRRGFRFVIGALAYLLSGIGIANVFASALGQLYQRRKEFARYISVGISPRDIRNMLIMEAAFVSFRPMMYSLLINVPVTALTLKSASFTAAEFLPRVPAAPNLVFAIFVLFFVGLAYYLGGRMIWRAGIVDLLKDETMI